MVRAIASSLYLLVAVVFLAAGAAVFLLPTGLLPASVADFVRGFGQGDAEKLHLIQELGSVLVFTGMISLWFAARYDQSAMYHWSMTLMWALFALAHWMNADGVFHADTRAFLYTVPFAVFVLVGLVRRRAPAARP
jgi:hypothetical protein